MNSKESADSCTKAIKVQKISRIPVCGNSICEAGEAEGLQTERFGHQDSCPADCPLSLDK